jgi:hypothetical protein
MMRHASWAWWIGAAVAAALSMVDDSLQDLQDRRICLSSGLFLLDWGLILPKISQQQ